jgi:hypothetical protein
MANKDYQMNGLRLKYPSEWTVESMSADAAAFLPPGSVITDITGEKFTAMNTDVKKFERMPDLKGMPLTAENIADASLKAMQAKGYKSEKSSVAMEIGGLEGRMFTVESDIGGTKIRTDQYFVVKGEKAYLMAYTAKTESYAKYAAMAASILKSVQFE